jgi:glutathione S-transferase
MLHLELFGTLTSPYVRRIRITAHELGIQPTWVDTSTESGQAALRELNPIWKVPAARIDGEPVFDSNLIHRALVARAGPGPLTNFDPVDVGAANTVCVIDGALDALINVFYLNKEGLHADRVGYLQKQRDRAESCLDWLESKTATDGVLSTERFGSPEIALVTAIDWMRFRNMCDVDRHQRLVACVRHHSERDSVRSTTLPGQ